VPIKESYIFNIYPPTAAENLMQIGVFDGTQVVVGKNCHGSRIRIRRSAVVLDADDTCGGVGILRFCQTERNYWAAANGSKDSSVVCANSQEEYMFISGPIRS
jgi:hypothetical protein